MLDESSTSSFVDRPVHRRTAVRARQPWRCEPVLAGGPLDAALDRSGTWCRVWWDRLHGSEPWLTAIPDIGPSCEVLLADALFHDLAPREREGLLAWVRSQQHEDGSWRDAQNNVDLSLTCLGYWARVQAGDDPDSQPLAKALRLIHELGGARRANLTVRLWLAMAGAVDWSWVPAVPSELFLLPDATPVSPARLSPWARQMVTALHVLAHGPARVHVCEVPELLLYNRRDQPIPPRLTSPGLAGDLLQAFDTSIKLARRLPIGALRRRSLARAMQWIGDSQQAHGGWFSARPTLYSLLALRVMGVHSDDLRIRRGLEYLRRARGTVEIESGRVLAQGLTGRPLAELARLGVAAGREPDRLLATEIAQPGPWQRRADAPIGGWPVEQGAQSHLDLHTTCAVLHALRGVRTTATRASLRRAAEVMLAMQERDGSFARFERGESDVPLSHLPWRDADQLNFGSSGARIDEDRVVLTADVVRELAVLGWRREDDRIDLACRWLERAHAESGHAWSVATLAAVVRAAAVQCVPDDPLRKSCERQLRTKQWEDGSFGDELSTARALLALIACGGPCVQAERAARQLVRRVGERARERDGDAPSIPDARVPGYGLSSRLCDPTAGAREIHAALSSFRREVGELATEAMPSNHRSAS
jgi:squalene-hopene/tetraprenyl-beta-curcumene cyclase